MNNRILEISQMGAYLSIERGFIKISIENDKDYKVPIDDIGSIIANSYRLSYSNNLLVSLAERNIPLIICGSNHNPVGILWSLESHSLQSGRLDYQINAKKTLYKKSWQEIIKTKISNQAVCLKALGKNSIKIKTAVKNVLSGDSSNQEGYAARIYWQELFGKDFVRDREQTGVNALLNYGYTILRSGISRAIMGAGLHPGIGIFHRNKANHMRLSDDLMEPFRPIVDYFVYHQSLKSNPVVLTPDIKKLLVDILYLDMDSYRGRSPVFTRMQSLATSFALSLERLKISLDLPILKESDLTEKQ